MLTDKLICMCALLNLNQMSHFFFFFFFKICVKLEVKAFKSRELIHQWPQGGPVSPLIIGLKTALHMLLRQWTFFLQSCVYMHLNSFRKITFYANITFSVSVFLKRLAIFLFASWNYQCTLPPLGNTPVFPEREMVAEWLGHISHSKCVDDVTLGAGCLLQVIAPTPFATFHLFIYRNKDQQLFLENILCNWNQDCLIDRLYAHGDAALSCEDSFP